jgi:hypothetical protein
MSDSTSSGSSKSASISESSSAVNYITGCCLEGVPEIVHVDLGAGGWTNEHCDSCTSVSGHYALSNCEGLCVWAYIAKRVCCHTLNPTTAVWYSIWLRLSRSGNKWYLIVSLKSIVTSSCTNVPNVDDACSNVLTNSDIADYEGTDDDGYCWNNPPITLTKIVHHGGFGDYTDLHTADPNNGCLGHLPDTVTIY